MATAASHGGCTYQYVRLDKFPIVDGKEPDSPLIPISLKHHGRKSGVMEDWWRETTGTPQEHLMPGPLLCKCTERHILLQKTRDMGMHKTTYPCGKEVQILQLTLPFALYTALASITFMGRVIWFYLQKLQACELPYCGRKGS